MSEVSNRAANHAIIERELDQYGSEFRWKTCTNGDVLTIDPGSPPAYHIAFADCMLEDDLGGERLAEALRSSEFMNHFYASHRLALVVSVYPDERLRLEANVVPELPEWAR